MLSLEDLNDLENEKERLDKFYQTKQNSLKKTLMNQIKDLKESNNSDGNILNTGKEIKYPLMMKIRLKFQRIFFKLFLNKKPKL